MSYSHYDYHSAMDIESSPYGGVYSAPTFSFVHESPQQDCALIAQVADNYVAPIKRPLKQFTRKRKPASSCGGASSPVALAAQLSPSASPVGSPTLAAPTSSTKKHWHRPEPVSDDSDEARFCKACGITTTPQWRRGPDGERSLCNACGLHFYKILQREKTTERKREVGTKLPIEMLLNDPDY